MQSKGFGAERSERPRESMQLEFSHMRARVHRRSENLKFYIYISGAP